MLFSYLDETLDRYRSKRFWLVGLIVNEQQQKEITDKLDQYMDYLSNLYPECLTPHTEFHATDMINRAHNRKKFHQQSNHWCKLGIYWEAQNLSAVEENFKILAEAIDLIFSVDNIILQYYGFQIEKYDNRDKDFDPNTVCLDIYVEQVEKSPLIKGKGILKTYCDKTSPEKEKIYKDKFDDIFQRGTESKYYRVKPQKFHQSLTPLNSQDNRMIQAADLIAYVFHKVFITEYDISQLGNVNANTAKTLWKYAELWEKICMKCSANMIHHCSPRTNTDLVLDYSPEQKSNSFLIKQEKQQSKNLCHTKLPAIYHNELTKHSWYPHRHIIYSNKMNGGWH